MPKYSFIIPVFNRPQELLELLKSIDQQILKDFEVIVVEDGSTVSSENVIEPFMKSKKYQYFKKSNSGPGFSRNHAATKASGPYLIFLDSDCLVPPDYLNNIETYLSKDNVDIFGGPDRAHESFSVIQKAINYAMTSFLTTGGIRGGKKQLEKYKPRSFNMGIKKGVFQQIGGFNEMRFGEDIDLSIRLEKRGYKPALIDTAFVYHKRRTSFIKFFKQVYNSGVARIHLSALHKGSIRIVHLMPSAFVLFCLVILALSFMDIRFLFPVVFLSLILFIHSTWLNRSISVGFLSLLASFIQLAGYGLGFIQSLIQVSVFGLKPKFGFEKNFYH